MKMLTVSIAAYNMEDYIRQTLDSLTDERVVDDLEVFVVDDGGTDRTLDIAKEYAARYPNTFFPAHKENGGYGTTVNYSIAHATGRYFKLLDGDDWFDREGLYRLVTALKAASADIVITPYHRIYQDGQVKKESFPLQYAGKTVDLSQLEYFPSMWSISYRTEALKKSNVQLPAHILYTDSLYSVIPLWHCKTAMFLDETVYCYRLGRDGQSTSREAYIAHAEEGLDIARRLCCYYQDNRKTCPNKHGLKKKIAGTYSWAITFLLIQKPSEKVLERLKAYETEIHHLAPEIYKHATKIGKKGILLTLLRKTNYAAYWLLKLIPGGFPFHP